MKEKVQFDTNDKKEIMTEPTLKKLGAADFNSDKYVKELSQQCVGIQELQRVRSKIQSLSDEASGALKKNVYHNYMQFIDTAREISHLEGEMYQLSQMLTEQRSLLAELASTSILGDGNKTAIGIEGSTEKQSQQAITEDTSGLEQEEENRRHKLTAILEKVEGCMSLLEPAGRLHIHDGDLVELDPLENTALQRIHAYLFSDCLMLTTWIPNRRGPVRYKFQATYEVDSLAVVNVRDLSSVKHAFKLLAFPDTRVFQCSSNTTKKEWLDKFDHIKKIRLGQEQIKREGTGTERSPSRSMSIDSPVGNPFLSNSVTDVYAIPEWLSEAPEDLDVFLAQRHLEEALQLLEKSSAYLSEQMTPDHTDNKLIDIKQKVDARRKALIEVLMKELEVSPDKSLQGGLRAARRSVRLLKQLDKSTQACELFLQLCSSILRTHFKRVKREGSTSVYVRHLAAVVFTNMCDIAEEFLRAFPDSPSCASAFVVWVSSEVGVFTSHLIKQLFHAQTSISVLAECITCVRQEAEKLWDYGVDIVYQIGGAVRTPLCRALRDARDKLVDAARLRAAEDHWRPTNLTSSTGLARSLNHHAELGLKLDAYVTGDCWLELTGNTMYFIKMYLTLVDDCLKLSSPEIQFTLDETLFDVFQAQLKHVEASLNNEKNSEAKTRQFILKNATFLLEVLLPLVEKKYADKVGYKCQMLARLRDEYCTLRKTSSITKYSSTEYL